MHIVKASLLNIVGRIVSILSTFFSIYLLGRFFNPSEFGYWTWLFSIFSLITAQDFGFVAAMRVRLGQAFASGDDLAQKQLFATAFCMTLVVSFSLMLLAALLLGEASSKTVEILIVIAASLITVIGYCASQGSVAYLESGWIGIAESLRGAFQILVIFCAKYLGLDFSLTLILFYIFTALYTPFITLVFLRSRQWHVRELVHAFMGNLQSSVQQGLSLLKKGSYLWLMQIGLAVLSLSDVFIAGLLVSDDEVAVVNAIVRLVLVAVGFVMAAMTPVMGHFVAKLDVLDRDTVWQRYSAAAGVLTLIGTVYGIFLYQFGPIIIELWANLSVDSSYVLIIAGLLFSVIGLVILLQTFMQLPVFTKAVLPLLVTSGLLKLALPYVLVPITGYAGVLLGSFIVNLAFVVIVTFMLFKRGYIEKILSTTKA